MTRPPLPTKSGRDFYEVSSLLQKSLRRGDVVYASRAVSELLPRYANYCWNRLLIVTAEDCADLVTQEVVALWQAWTKVRADVKDKDSMRGQIFFAKAIVLLAKCKHSRDADELLILVSNRLPDSEFNAAIAQCEAVVVEEVDWDIPEWVYDVHTWQGKRRGKTRQQFVRDEHDALTDASTIFANADEMIDSPRYVQPELDWGHSDPS